MEVNSYSRVVAKDLWSTITPMIKTNEFGQSVMFISPNHVNLKSFIAHLSKTILCMDTKKPCGECKSCLLMLSETHPDLIEIFPEKVGGVIKIAQIRDLGHKVIATPVIGNKIVVVVKDADMMNMASYNALLKLLEEPPKHLHFLLFVEQEHRLPATILSRCQKYVGNGDMEYLAQYSELGRLHPKDSSRFILLNDEDNFLNKLIDMVEGRQTVCSFAAALREHSLDDITWCLYIIVAEVIKAKITGACANASIKCLQEITNLNSLFVLLAKINSIREKSDVYLNHALTVESLLVEMCEI